MLTKSLINSPVQDKLFFFYCRSQAEPVMLTIVERRETTKDKGFDMNDQNIYWVEFNNETGLRNECYETFACSVSEVISEANARFIDSKLVCLTSNNVLVTLIEEL